MIERASSTSTFTMDSDRPAFLGTHRAQSVAGREFTRFSEALVAAAKQAAGQRTLEAPTTRLSPDRCIVQLGPVALTVAYIRVGTNLPVGGQLLAIIWRGTIAQRGDHIPERLGARKVPTPPVQVWEETHVVTAENEANWQWHPSSVDAPGYTSADLAAHCIAQLCRALEDCPAISA